MDNFKKNSTSKDALKRMNDLSSNSRLEEFAEDTTAVIKENARKVGKNVKKTTQKVVDNTVGRLNTDQLEEFAEDLGDNMRRVGRNMRDFGQNVADKTKEQMNKMKRR